MSSNNRQMNNQETSMMPGKTPSNIFFYFYLKWMQSRVNPDLFATNKIKAQNKTTNKASALIFSITRSNLCTMVSTIVYEIRQKFYA